MTKNQKRAFAGLIIGGFGFLLFTIGVCLQAHWIQQYDSIGIDWAHGVPVNWQHFFKWYTTLGNEIPTFLYAGIAALILYWQHQKRALWFLAVNMLVLDGIVNYLIKNIVRRPRPEFWRLIKIGGYSFPSGHATNVTILIGTLIIISWTILQRRLTRYLVTAVGTCLILLMLASRVIVGVHYPSDVTAGMFYGLFAISLASWIFNYQIIHHKE